MIGSRNLNFRTQPEAMNIEYESRITETFVEAFSVLKASNCLNTMDTMGTREHKTMKPNGTLWSVDELWMELLLWGTVTMENNREQSAELKTIKKHLKVN